MTNPSPLTVFVGVQRVTDAEVRRTFAAAARSVRNQLEALMNKRTFSAATQARRLQIVSAELQRIITPHWDTVNNSITRGIRRATNAAAKVQTDWEADLRRTVGSEAAQLPEAYRVAARRIANQYLQHGFNGKPLSERVYHARDLDADRIRSRVRAGILTQQDPRKIAQDVERYIKPTTPGGTHYAALRVARTEMNNAFHDTARQEAKGSPWTQSMQWHLSGRHPEPDECNEYADTDKHALGKGAFPVDDVPDKPHPQCLCFVTPNLPSPAQAVAMLRASRTTTK